MNEAYPQAHQKSRREIIGHSVADLLGADAFEQVVKEKLDRCLAGEEIHYQAWFDFPGSGRRYMDVAYYAYVEADGAISGAVVSSRDMTEFIQAQKSLKESEEKFKQMFETMNNGVAVYEAVDDGQDFIYILYCFLYIASKIVHCTLVRILIYGAENQKMSRHLHCKVRGV